MKTRRTEWRDIAVSGILETDGESVVLGLIRTALHKREVVAALDKKIDPRFFDNRVKDPHDLRRMLRKAVHDIGEDKMSFEHCVSIDIDDIGMGRKVG